MIREEAYNKMTEGYAITHKLFRSNEYLYMDESFIIRNENDDAFENEWDIKSHSEWLTDWYIYKGKGANIRKNKSNILKRLISKNTDTDNITYDYNYIEYVDEYENKSKFNKIKLYIYDHLEFLSGLVFLMIINKVILNINYIYNIQLIMYLLTVLIISVFARRDN